MRRRNISYWCGSARSALPVFSRSVTAADPSTTDFPREKNNPKPQQISERQRVARRANAATARKALKQMHVQLRIGTRPKWQIYTPPLRRRCRAHCRCKTYERHGQQCRNWALPDDVVCRLDVVGPVEQLGVDAVAFDQPVEMIPTPPAAPVALDVEHVELPERVAEDDRAIAGHWPLFRSD
jgi:hypothetical protein